MSVCREVGIIFWGNLSCLGQPLIPLHGSREVQVFEVSSPFLYLTKSRHHAQVSPCDYLRYFGLRGWPLSFAAGFGTLSSFLLALDHIFAVVKTANTFLCFKDTNKTVFCVTKDCPLWNYIEGIVGLRRPRPTILTSLTSRHAHPFSYRFLKKVLLPRSDAFRVFFVAVYCE